MPLWDGRFEGEPSVLMQQFSESLGVDLRMFEEDIEGSIAHATMLGETGIISADEAETLRSGLESVRLQLRDKEFIPDIAAEDIHMAVEGRLLERLGDVAGKLHTARSRNDQVATDVRLWMRRRLDWLDEALEALIATLLSRIVADGRTLMPGFTHLQRGQPIWLGHHLLAHVWPLVRDRGRLADARRRLNQSPLGAGAMAGTSHPINRQRTAQLLDFDAPVENAMDAVAARDHELEVVAACAILQTHLSRMAEDLILWSTQEFNFIRMGEDFSTGSSIMPQKRNPDAAELVRGKTGRVVGDLSALLVMVKGLPLAYNRDLQEDRHALFDAIETTLDCVRVMEGMWCSLLVHREHYEKKLHGDFLLATELADYLAARGVPFREAHHVAGRLVRWCEDRGGNFNLLDLATLREHHEAFGADALEWLEPAAAVERRRSFGGTAWSEIMRQVELLRKTDA